MNVYGLTVIVTDVIRLADYYKKSCEHKKIRDVFLVDRQALVAGLYNKKGKGGVSNKTRVIP